MNTFNFSKKKKKKKENKDFQVNQKSYFETISLLPFSYQFFTHKYMINIYFIYIYIL